MSRYVPQHDEDSAALSSEGVLHGDLNIVERDECCACGGGIGRLDRFRLNAFLAFDEDDGETVLESVSVG